MDKLATAVIAALVATHWAGVSAAQDLGRMGAPVTEALRGAQPPALVPGGAAVPAALAISAAPASAAEAVRTDGTLAGVSAPAAPGSGRELSVVVSPQVTSAFGVAPPAAGASSTAALSNRIAEPAAASDSVGTYGGFASQPEIVEARPGGAPVTLGR